MSENSISPKLLRQLREKAGYSVEDVVQKLKERGLTLSSKTLYGYENGVGTPKVNTFMALCEIYKVNDVLSTFGYSDSSMPTYSTWDIDQYNDFFNSGLLDKVYLLCKWGVPSFAGYEKQLEESLPPSAEVANYNRLNTAFSKLDEFHQGLALLDMEEMLENRDHILQSDHERELVLLYRRAVEGDKIAINSILEKYKANPSEKAV